MSDNYLNVVTCGSCGEPFAHKPQYEQKPYPWSSDLTCPYCKFTSDPCDFPDIISGDEVDALIRIPTKEEVNDVS